MGDMGDADFEYTSPMEEVAISMHEMYTTLRSAGFSRRDGLELVARMLVMGLNEVIDDEEYDTEEDE